MVLAVFALGAPVRSLQYFRQRSRRWRSYWRDLLDLNRLGWVGGPYGRRCTQGSPLEFGKEVASLVRDSPCAAFTSDESLAERIKIRRKISETLHTQRPFRAARIENREMQLDKLKVSPAVGLPCQNLQYGKLKTHARHSNATTQSLQSIGSGQRLIDRPSSFSRRCLLGKPNRQG